LQLTFHGEGPGKIDGLLCPNSWREIDQARNPSYIKLENTWIVLNCGGGLTPNKPEVFLELPSDSFLPSHYPILTAGNDAVTCVTRRLPHRGRSIYSTRRRLVQQPQLIWREVRDGLRLHWKSTGAWTGLTCVPMVRFGVGLRFERLRTLAQLCASASRVRWAGCCVSLRRAARSLAAPQRDKKSLDLPSLDSN
jgi:hypothetical protein